MVPEKAREQPQMSQLRLPEYTSRPQLRRQSQRVDIPGRGTGARDASA